MGAVLVDDTARSASRTMLNTIDNDLPNTLSKLIGAGDDLANPQHWDGPTAADFRNNIWATLKPDLNNLKTKLADLQSSVDKVLTNITQAGGGS